jgi:hypothetical protein
MNIILFPPQPKLEHTYFVCKCNSPTCGFCEGGLSYCTVCCAGEGELLEECPGRKLTEEENKANYEAMQQRWKDDLEQYQKEKYLYGTH